MLCRFPAYFVRKFRQNKRENISFEKIELTVLLWWKMRTRRQDLIQKVKMRGGGKP